MGFLKDYNYRVFVSVGGVGKRNKKRASAERGSTVYIRTGCQPQESVPEGTLRRRGLALRAGDLGDIPITTPLIQL